MHKAIRKGNLRVIKQLLVKGANSNIKDNSDRTPLQLAEETYGGPENDEDDFDTLIQI